MSRNAAPCSKSRQASSLAADAARVARISKQAWGAAGNKPWLGNGPPGAVTQLAADDLAGALCYPAADVFHGSIHPTLHSLH